MRKKLDELLVEASDGDSALLSRLRAARHLEMDRCLFEAAHASMAIDGGASARDVLPGLLWAIRHGHTRPPLHHECRPLVAVVNESSPTMPAHGTRSIRSALEASSTSTTPPDPSYGVDVVWRLAELLIGIACQRSDGHDAPHCECEACIDAVLPAYDLVDAKLPQPARVAQAHEFACAVKSLTDHILARLTRLPRGQVLQ